MKTYLRHKTKEEVQDNCHLFGFVSECGQYDLTDEHVRFGYYPPGLRESSPIWVYYNPVNGHFFGSDEYGYFFDNESNQLDHECWYSSLLDFLYVKKSNEVAA